MSMGWRVLCFAAGVLFLGISGVAAADDSLNKNALLQRFEHYGMNYAIFQHSEYENLNRQDEAAIEAHYSFKYTFFNCELGQSTHQEALSVCSKSAVARFYAYLSYTGEFDFYAGTRYSGPVINRTSNPALHFLWQFNDRGTGINWFDLGVIEHRSNGQVTEIDATDDVAGSATQGQFITQIEYNNGNDEFFDGLSRGSNYASLAIGNHQSNDFHWSSSLKLYYTQNSKINWGRLANKDVSIADYDRLNLNLRNTWQFGSAKDHFSSFSLSVEYMLGDDWFDTDSVDINFIFPYQSKYGLEIPWLIRAHFGPMDRLSDYTESVTSIGIGLAFSI